MQLRPSSNRSTLAGMAVHILDDSSSNAIEAIPAQNEKVLTGLDG